MNPKRLLLPCGCPVIADWTSGERRVVCRGDGLTADDQPVSWKVCEGGRGYIVRAEQVTDVRYSVRPLAVLEEAP